MRRLVKAGLCGMAAAMLLTAGCSGKKEEAESGAATESSAETAAAETQAEEYVADSSVKLGDYKGIEVTVAKAEVTEKELEAQIQQILNANAEYVETDRAAALGDTVNIDYKGLLDGEAFDGGTAEDYDLELGSGNFIDGFEDGLVGTKKGEQKSLNLTFPEEYHSEELAGKDVVFEVTVNAVKERVVPELTDAFVAEKYPDYETVEKLKAELYDGMLKQEQQNIDNQRDTDILNHIVENSEIVCSTDEIDDAYNIQLNSYITMLTGYGMDIKSYAGMMGMTEDDFKAEIRNMAKEMAKQELVLKEIAKAENITVDDAEKEQLAKDYGYENVEAMLKNVNITQDMIDDTALMQKTLDFLAENAQVTVEE
ncbi:MAG: trigger factor [Clostridium sp.]|nr:trigger factor [Clostridium sp.]